MSCRPLLGILMLDTVFTRIEGDIGSPDTFSFPVLFKKVKGASPSKIVEEQDPAFLDPFIEAARELVASGVKAITTSCGFLAVFQKELAQNVDVPVFTSSLLQIPWAYSLIRPEKKIGVITANAAALTDNHFKATGSLNIPKVVAGMEEYECFYNVFVKQTSSLDSMRLNNEMYEAARRLSTSSPEIGSIILECTNMPPFAKKVKEAAGVPVYDIVTLTNWVAQAVYSRSFEL